MNYLNSISIAILFFESLLCMDSTIVLTPEDLEIGTILLQRDINYRKSVLQCTQKRKSPYTHSPENQLIHNRIIEFIHTIYNNKILLGNALLICCQRKLLDAATFLVDCDAPMHFVNERGQNILHLLANIPDITDTFCKFIVNKLNEKDGTLLLKMLEHRDQDGQTPLNIAYSTCSVNFISEVIPFCGYAQLN